MKKIESDQNAYFRALKKCLKTPGIKKENMFMAMGNRIVTEALDHPHLKLESLLVTKKMFVPNKFVSKSIELTESLFKELDIFETTFPIAVFILPEFQTWKESPPQGLELYVPVQDPANLGSIIRSCVAFGIEKIILLKESAHPFHPKTIRASSGMSLNMTFEMGPSIKEISKKVPNLLALDMNGESVHEYNWQKNCSLIVGEEGQGLPETLKKHTISIPISKKCESLNASIAVGIALYEYRKKHT